MKPIRHYARMTLECRTPLSIASGRADAHYDVQLVRDANGLPVLPGTSLVGVLRHAFAQAQGEDEADALFGYQKGDRGQPSALRASWGHIHDSHDTPVEGLLDAGRENDPLLREYLRQIEHPMMRNRVRLNERGAAADTGKFDRSIVPAGSRFSFELCLHGEHPENEHWNTLLALLARPDFRLGGNTRAGLGRLDIVRLHIDRYDLRQPADAARLRARPHRLDTPIQGGESRENLPSIPDTSSNHWQCVTLELRPSGYWRIGQGNQPTARDNDKTADLLPVTERRVIWTHGQGRLNPQAELLVPASALKGALRHRMAFHAACLARYHGHAMSSEDAIAKLFGQIKDSTNEGGAGNGRARQLLLDDQYLPIHPNKHQMIMHNVIDRFTGGVREHLLFAEEMLWDTALKLTLHLPADLPDTVREAFKRSLDDLCEGRLALGGGGSRGHGFFTGTHSFEARA